MVCSQLEDVQQEVHIQFDSRPGENPVIQTQYKLTLKNKNKDAFPAIKGKQESLNNI